MFNTNHLFSQPLKTKFIFKGKKEKVFKKKNKNKSGFSFPLCLKGIISILITNYIIFCKVLSKKYFRQTK